MMDSLFAGSGEATWQPIHPRLHLGTSSFSHESWVGSFYPAGTKPGDFLGTYSRRFDTVEIDATFYRIPSGAQVRNWAAKVPPGFKIAAKFPQEITHEKILLDCDAEREAFLGAMDELGDRSGPLLLQFPYFRRDAFSSAGAFVDRLAPFLESLPTGRSFAVEIRNKSWVGDALFSLLRRHHVAFALIDHPWMPPVDQILREHDVVTAGFVYVRWLGDRKGIETKTESWEKIIVDRSKEMERWVPALASLLEGNIEVYGYFNNHYAGHAPGSIALLRETWRRQFC